MPRQFIRDYCFTQKSETKGDLQLRDDLASGLDSLHVQRDEVVMTLGQCFLESFLHALVAHHGSHLQQSAQHNHVEHLGVLQLGSLVHGVNAIDGDVLTRRRIDDAVAVVDKNASGFDLRHELVERR